jgi:hypothetical protein
MLRQKRQQLSPDLFSPQLFGANSRPFLRPKNISYLLTLHSLLRSPPSLLGFPIPHQRYVVIDIPLRASSRVFRYALFLLKSAAARHCTPLITSVHKVDCDVDELGNDKVGDGLRGSWACCCHCVLGKVLVERLYVLECR